MEKLCKMVYLQKATADAQMEEIIDFIHGDNITPALMEFSVAFEEAFMNIATHAYGEEGGPASIVVTKTDHKVVAVLDDCGIPYDPTLKNPEEKAKDFKIGGQGIRLMNEYSKMSYARVFGHNLLKMERYL